MSGSTSLVIPGDRLVSAGESSSGVAGIRVTEPASLIRGVCVCVCVCVCERMHVHAVCVCARACMQSVCVCAHACMQSVCVCTRTWQSCIYH